MLILGIDPSLRNTGLAILDAENKKIIYKRTIKTRSYETIDNRLQHIYGHIRELLKNTPIDRVAIETQYLGKHSSVLKIAMVYGACLVACDGKTISHYTPKCIKKNTTGIGYADKHMVINAVKLIYDIKDDIDSHVADAIALAHVDHQFV